MHTQNIISSSGFCTTEWHKNFFLGLIFFFVLTIKLLESYWAIKTVFCLYKGFSLP